MKNPLLGDAWGESDFDQKDPDIYIFLEEILSLLNLRDIKSNVLPCINFNIARRILKGCLCVYARKCVLLLYARFGYVPPSGAVGFGHEKNISQKTVDFFITDDDKSEYDRLSLYLSLPTVNNMMLSVKKSEPIKRLVQHWCEHYLSHFPLPSDVDNSRLIREPYILIQQPVIFELIPLPKKLDSLLQTSLVKLCNKCRTVPQVFDINLKEPAICLFCGEYVCSQSFCCAENSIH